MRAVVDPNVFVSAAITPRGTTGRVLRAGLEGRYRLVACPQLVSELDVVLQRPSFRRHLTEDEARELVTAIEGIADSVPDPDEVRQVCRDPDDDYLFALAERAGVDLIVSGDTDLAAVDPSPVEVVAPRAFLDRLGLP